MDLRENRIFLVVITIIITLIVSTVVSIGLSSSANLSVPSLGTITTLGVEAYWDSNCENKTMTIDWGQIHSGTSKNVTLYLKSASNFETTLRLNMSNWNPPSILNYMMLVWDYNGTTIKPGEIKQVALTLNSVSSKSFMDYLLDNGITNFSFDMTISAYHS